MNKNIKVRNTKERGVFEFLIYPEGKKFVGVCLTLNIIEEGYNPQKLWESLKEAAFGHLEVVRKENLSDNLLNRAAPQEYWNKYYTVKILKETQKILQKDSQTRKTPPIFIPVKQELVYT